MSSTGFDCTDVLAPTFSLAANKNVFPSPGTERVISHMGVLRPISEKTGKGQAGSRGPASTSFPNSFSLRYSI